MTENELFGNSEQLDDTISRAAVVDAIEGVDWYHINKNGEMVHGANDNDHQAWYKAEDIYKAMESVPSAQPEITYQICADALLKMWMDDVLTDGDYKRIMNKLNAWKGEQP